VDAEAVAVIEVDAEEIELIAGLATGAAAKAQSGRRRAADVPVGDVKVVDVLLDDVVTRHLREADPVAHHVVGVALVGFLGLVPQRAAAPPDRAAGDLADGAALQRVLDALIAGLMPPLSSGHDGQALLLGHLASRDDLATARRVHRHRLFHEHVLARADRRVEVHRAEVGRGRHQDDLDVGVEQLLVAVGAAEASRFGHVVLLARGNGPVLEPVGGGDDLQVDVEDSGGLEAVFQGPGAAAATADQTHAEFLLRLGREQHILARQGGGHARSRTLDEVPTREIFQIVGEIVVHTRFLSYNGYRRIGRRRPRDQTSKSSQAR